jgi:hypothetical protein
MKEFIAMHHHVIFGTLDFLQRRCSNAGMKHGGIKTKVPFLLSKPQEAWQMIDEMDITYSLKEENSKRFMMAYFKVLHISGGTEESPEKSHLPPRNRFKLKAPRYEAGLLPITSDSCSSVLCYHIQTNFVAQPASYPLDTGSIFPGLKLPEQECDHSSHCSASI